MRTAVDTSVLLDVVIDDPRFADRSEAALRAAMQSGALIIGECVLAELSPALERDQVEEFLSDWSIEFIPSTKQAALLAGSMFRTYLSRREVMRSARVVADFLIAAHAATFADRLLARDRGYYRDYFESLRLLEP